MTAADRAALIDAMAGARFDANAKALRIGWWDELDDSHPVKRIRREAEAPSLDAALAWFGENGVRLVRTCEKCGGRGEVPGLIFVARKPCPSCGGSGVTEWEAD